MLPVQIILQNKGHAVHHVAPDATVYEALRLMAQHNCGALPVIEGGRPVGMMSERDYARKVVLVGKLSKETPVREIMDRSVYNVTPDTGIHECMALMTQGRTRHVLVCDGGKLVGLVSIGDVVKALMEDQQVTIEQLNHYITGCR